MTERSVTERVDDMLEMIDFIEANDTSSIDAPMTTKLAIERAFSILSEASRHIPDALKQTEPDIAWRNIAGIGNILRHDYQRVSTDILRKATVSHLPTLKIALLRLKAIAARS